MKTHIVGSFAVAWVALVALAACQSEKHVMVEPATGTRIMCQQCYTTMERVRGNYAPALGSRWGFFSGPDTIIERHHCTDCSTEMSIYTMDGTFMVRCARCVPEGVACDKCLPPKNYVPHAP